MQYPTEVPGVALDAVMTEALAARRRSVADVDALLDAEAAQIGLPTALLHRSLNVDLSGGEKKRNETLQLAVLRPRIAILDELDSGLDVDALRACSKRIEVLTQRPTTGPKALGCWQSPTTAACSPNCTPTAVHILIKGRIVASGGPSSRTNWRRTATAPSAPTPTTADATEWSEPASSLDDLFRP